MSAASGEQSLQRMKKLKLVLLLTATYLAAEVVGAVVTGSLALLADAGHMLTDAGGLALAFFAVSFSRKPATPRRTYGFYRLEILASLANSVVLILLSIFVMYEAYRRFIEPPEVQSLPMIIVAAVGLVVNFAGLKILGEGHRHTHSKSTSQENDDHNHHDNMTKNERPKNLNIEGARLEVLSDTIGPAGVIVAGIVMMFTNFYLIDPIVGIGLAIFILPRTWSLMKSIHILMEGAPAHVSYEEVRKAILGVKGVTGLFELHIWSITSGMDALSTHVVVIDPSRSQAILQEINSVLERQFGIIHSTIQIESYHPQPDSTT